MSAFKNSDRLRDRDSCFGKAFRTNREVSDKKRRKKKGRTRKVDSIEITSSSKFRISNFYIETFISKTLFSCDRLSIR